MAMALTSWLQTFIMARVSQSAVRDLRQDIFNHLQVLPLRFLTGVPVGYHEPGDQ